MKQTTSGVPTPTANICIGKSRIKLYKNAGDLPTYYLEKGQEFQIEIFNPTQNVILARISLNDKPIGQGGLVLNPGERVFLDRYVDVAKKFLFDTYEVSNTEEVKQAIAKNGDFKVEFFKEKTPTYHTYSQSYPNIFINGSNTSITRSCYTNTINTGLAANTPISNSSGSITTTNLNTNLSNTSTTGSFNLTNVSNTTFDSLNDNSAYGQASLSTFTTCDSAPQELYRSFSPEEKSIEKSVPRTRSITKKIETGRVEMGSNSNQSLTPVYKNWESYYFHKIEYKMLPLSQQIVSSKDISVKRYCTNCAHKLKPEFKFCPVCATKI